MNKEASTVNRGLLSLQQIIDSCEIKFNVICINADGRIRISDTEEGLYSRWDSKLVSILTSYTGNWEDSVTYRTGYIPPMVDDTEPKEPWELDTIRGVVIDGVEYRAEVVGDLLYVLQKMVKYTPAAYSHLEGVSYDGSKLDLFKTIKEDVKYE